MKPNNRRIEYFIDGAMSFLQIGYVMPRKDDGPLFHVLLGDIVAARGKLADNDFRIDDFTHSLVVAYPKDFQVQEEARNRISSVLESSGLWREKEWAGITFKFIPYPVERNDDSSSNGDVDSSSRNTYIQAKHAILDEMRQLEKRLLDSALDKCDDARVYIDGEFQTDDTKYQGRVLSICKQLSLIKIAKRIERGEKLVSEIVHMESEHMESDNPCTSVFRWNEKGIEGMRYKRNWWTWYLKLRDNPLRDRDAIMSDIIQCTVQSQDKPSEEIIKEWNANLQRLSFPTCYGLDKKRWRTHIYQIYLTELFCKNQSINGKALEYLAYGNR